MQAVILRSQHHTAGLQQTLQLHHPAIEGGEAITQVSQHHDATPSR